MKIPWLSNPRDPRHKLGLQGEARAARHLRRQGFRILHQNYCAPGGEIDIIAERRGEVHFVEVKTRVTDAFGTPEEAVTPSKRQRIRRAAQHYLAQFRAAPTDVHFDTLGVELDSRGRLREPVRWTPSAF